MKAKKNINYKVSLTSNLIIAPQSKSRRDSVAFKLSSHVTYCAFQVVKQRETHNSSSGSNIYLWLLHDCTGPCVLTPCVSIFINWTKQSSDGAPSLPLSVCYKKLHIRLTAFLMRTGGLWALWVCIFSFSWNLTFLLKVCLISALNFPGHESNSKPRTNRTVLLWKAGLADGWKIPQSFLILPAHDWQGRYRGKKKKCAREAEWERCSAAYQCSLLFSRRISRSFCLIAQANSFACGRAARKTSHCAINCSR